MQLVEKKPLIARAFEIGPYCHNNKAVRSRLKCEGYTLREIEATLIGRSFRSQLKALRKGTSPSVELHLPE